MVQTRQSHLIFSFTIPLKRVDRGRIGSTISYYWVCTSSLENPSKTSTTADAVVNAATTFILIHPARRVPPISVKDAYPGDPILLVVILDFRLTNYLEHWTTLIILFLFYSSLWAVGLKNGHGPHFLSTPDSPVQSWHLAKTMPSATGPAMSALPWINYR